MAGKPHWARIGTAAFALGVVSMGGPQSLGVAAADSGEDGPSAASSSSDASRPAPPSRRGQAPSRKSPVRSAPVTPSADSTPPVGLGAPAPAAATRAARSGASQASNPVAQRRGSTSPRPAGPADALPAALAIAPPAGPTQSAAPAVPAANAVPAVNAPAPATPAVSVKDRSAAVKAALRSLGAGQVQPVAIARVQPPIAQAVVLQQARVQQGVTALVNAIAHWANGLPGGNTTAFLAGAIDIIRRNLFNQGPSVTPIQLARTRFTPPDVLKGDLGVIDFERDAWTATVTTAPNNGSVDLDPQTGRYTYTAGATFTGSDSFTVRVAPTTPAFNILAPFGDGSTTLTIQVGDQALTNPWQSSLLTAGLPASGTHQDPIDASLYLPDAPVDVSIRKAAGQAKYTVTVTTKTITGKTNIQWLTPTGSTGTLSTKTFLDQHWDEFKLKSTQNGQTGATVTIDYINKALADPANPGDRGEVAIIITDVGAPTRTADGQYQFTGTLAPSSSTPSWDTSAEKITNWDVLGTSFRKPFERFLKANSLYGPVAQALPVRLNLSLDKSAVFLDSYTPVSYQQDGLIKEAAAPTAITTTSTTDGSAAPVGVTDGTGVTAAIPFGGNGAFLTGLATGEVDLWVSGIKTQLQNGGWKSAVTTMLELSEPLRDAQGNAVTTSFTGRIDNSDKTNPTGGGPGNTLTVTAVAPNADIVVGQKIAGAGVADGTTITAFLTGTPGGVGTYSISGAPQAITATSLTQPDVPVLEDSFVVGLADGAVELWRESKGWTELKGVDTLGSPSERKVTAIIASGDPDGGNGSFVVGFGNGSLQRYSVHDDLAPTGLWGPTGNGVSTLVAYGDPASGRFLVGRNNGTVQLFTGTGFQELDGGWQSGVKSMMLWRNGVVVGLDNGSVHYWDGQKPRAGSFTQLQGTGWSASVGSIVPWNDGFIVGLSSGAVEYYSGSQWTELQGTGWKSAITTMIVNNDTELNADGNLVETPAGVIVGLANGAVEKWTANTGITPGSPKPQWTELHDASWANSINVLVPLDQYVVDDLSNAVLRETVIAGLGGGSFGTLQQWDGGVDGKGKAVWTLFNSGAVKLTPELAKQAVQYGWANGGQAAGSVTVDGKTITDPLFSQAAFQPGCTYTSDCDGNLYPVNIKIGTPGDPQSLASKNFAMPGTDASVDASYDLNLFAYGYVWVPNGVLNKLRPGQYSVAAIAAIPTGPSLTLNTGAGGTITTGDVPLISAQPFYGAYPLGTVAVDVGVNARLDAQLGGAADDQTKFRAYAYYVPTVLWTYNTQGNPGDVQMGYTAYPDVNFSDFQEITDVTITPTFTPYASIRYGLFTPASTPLIGQFSLFEAGLKYENPVSLTLKVPTSDVSNPSLSLSSEGDLSAFAGVIPTITDSLTWKATWEIYKYDNQLFGPSGADVSQPSTAVV